MISSDPQTIDDPKIFSDILILTLTAVCQKEVIMKWGNWSVLRFPDQKTLALLIGSAYP